MKRESSQFAFRGKYLILLCVAILVVGLDQLTKFWIVERFKLGETVSVVSNLFNITYVQNKGAAFGILSQANPAFRVPFFIFVPIVALLSIAYVFRKISDRDIKMSVALSLVISGAIGNLIDRLSLGYVVDFLDFHWKWTYHYPAFNVADSAICVGVGILMLDLLTSQTPTSATTVSADRKGTRANVSNTH